MEEILRIYKNKQIDSDEVGSYALKLNVEEENNVKDRIVSIRIHNIILDGTPKNFVQIRDQSTDF